MKIFLKKPYVVLQVTPFSWSIYSSSSETQGFKGDGKGRARLGVGKKGGGRGGEGKGKGKGEALGSFSIQIISRSKSKHHLRGVKQKRSYDKRDRQGSISTFKTAQQDMSTDQMISGKSFLVAFDHEHNRSNCRRSSISCLRSDRVEIFSLLFFVKVFCLIQFRLLGLKYPCNDGTMYYTEEIGARSLPNIKLNSLNSVVPVASFRSMSALSPIHAAVILLFLKDGTCSIMLDFNRHAANTKGNFGNKSLPAWQRFGPNPVGNSAYTSLPSTIFRAIMLCSFFSCLTLGNISNAVQTPCSKNSIM